MWELDCEEGWVPKNWCFWTVVLEKTLESPLDCKEIQPVHLEDQPWDFSGTNDAKAETPVLWPPHVKSWLIGKDWCWEELGLEEKRTTEDEMAGWHYWLDGCESEWTPGVGDGQGGLACCDSCSRKESDMTERMNWTELKNEEMEPKQKQHPVVDVTGDRCQVRCCKEQYCIGTWNVRSMNQGKLEVVKQMARVNVNILGISELKWTGMGEFNSDDCYIYYCGQESLRRNGIAIIVNKRVRNAVLGCNLKNDRMISVHFQGKQFRLFCWPWWLLHFFWGIPAHSSRCNGHQS